MNIWHGFSNSLGVERMLEQDSSEIFRMWVSWKTARSGRKRRLLSLQSPHELQWTCERSHRGSYDGTPFLLIEVRFYLEEIQIWKVQFAASLCYLFEDELRFPHITIDWPAFRRLHHLRSQHQSPTKLLQHLIHEQHPSSHLSRKTNITCFGRHTSSPTHR